MITSTSTDDAKPVLGLDTRDRRVMTRAVARRRAQPGGAGFSYLRKIRALAHGVLFSFAMASSSTLAGCVIPVPLEPQPPMDDKPPIIAKTEADPPFGVLHPPVGTRFSFTVRADDDDIDDQLFGNLFRSNTPNDPLVSISPINLSPAGDAAHPTRRIGESPKQDWCGALSITGSTMITVIVSDLAFQPGTDQTEGKTDRAVWVLTCQ